MTLGRLTSAYLLHLQRTTEGVCMADYTVLGYRMARGLESVRKVHVKLVCV